MVRNPATVGYEGPTPTGIAGYQAQLLVRGPYKERKPVLLGEVISLEQYRLQQEVEERKRIADFNAHLREEISRGRQ